MPHTTPDLIAELKWRGLFQQATHEAELDAHLRSGTRLGYIGFDPTSDSLTIGNLVQIVMLRHLQRAGHVPVVVMGGGTGLIGDPSGKSAERLLLTPEIVEAHIAGQRRIFERLLDFSPGPAAARLVNNHDWLGKLGYIEVLRDIGKHFSVNVMIQRDSVRERLHHRDQGISYTEFSYMLLQAYDFLELRRRMGVTLQMGGSDQWGNIVSGADLIRRLVPGGEAFGLTTPLVTKADGGKFGKSETGAVWLTADRTSPYAFYQFWLNTADQDVLRYLRLFTLLTADEIAELEAAHERDPGARVPHRALAREVTQLVHGHAEREGAEAAAAALFSGDLGRLAEATLTEVLASAPSTSHPLAELDGEGLPLVELLVQTSLVKSKREAREFLQSGAISVNGGRAEPAQRLTREALLHGKIIALRKGKKAWHVTRWE